MSDERDLGARLKSSLDRIEPTGYDSGQVVKRARTRRTWRAGAATIFFGALAVTAVTVVPGIFATENSRANSDVVGDPSSGEITPAPASNPDYTISNVRVTNPGAYGPQGFQVSFDYQYRSGDGHLRAACHVELLDSAGEVLHEQNGVFVQAFDPPHEGSASFRAIVGGNVDASSVESASVTCEGASND